MAGDGKSLSHFVEEVCPDSHLRVETDFGGGYVRLRSDEAERRQAAHDIRSTEDIVIELLRNARDAGAHNIFLAVSTEGGHRKLAIVDDGTGIPPALHELIFEPRVTSKLDTVHMDKWGIHGRGMALYSVTMNSEIAKVITSDRGIGAAIYVETDLSLLPEKSDQSTFPSVVTDGTKAIMRGPRNINRTAAEFALEHRSSLNVYLGSPSEIASTMYRIGCAVVPASMRSFACAFDDVTLYKRLAYATDEEAFARLCSEMGLSLSERNARRILDEQIQPCLPLHDVVRLQLEVEAQPDGRDDEGREAKTGKEAARPDVSRTPRQHPRLDKETLADVEKQVADVYQGIAQRYYLEPDVPVEAKVVGGILRISIPLVSDD